MSGTAMLTSNPYQAADGERRGGTVGLPLPGVSLRVQDDAGRDLACGEIGNIQVKVPKRCLLVAQLPRNDMGKVQKNVLRAQLGGFGEKSQ